VLVSAGGDVRQYLHTLDLSETKVSDASALASCKSLRTLNLRKTQVTDVSGLASCQSLHTLVLWKTHNVLYSANWLGTDFTVETGAKRRHGGHLQELRLGWCDQG
jgi:hypothetical protein